MNKESHELHPEKQNEAFYIEGKDGVRYPYRLFKPKDQLMPLCKVTFEDLSPEIQKMDLDIQALINEMDSNAPEKKDLCTMYGNSRSGNSVAAFISGRYQMETEQTADHVILVYDPEGKKAIGLFTSEKFKDNPHRAEFAVLIRSKFRGKGLFTKMLELEMQTTPEEEISEWEGEVLSDNENTWTAMDHLVEKNRFNASMIDYSEIRQRKEDEELKKIEKKRRIITQEDVEEYVYYLFTRETGEKRAEKGKRYLASTAYMNKLMRDEERMYRNF